MDQVPDAKRSGEPPPLLTWHIAVQIALGFLVTASLFFFLGRWTHVGAGPEPQARQRKSTSTRAST